MSMFKKLFAKEEGPKEPEFEIPWKLLQSMDQLDEIEQLSGSKPVVIFKHSTRCGISSMVLRQFKKSYGYTQDQIQPYFLDLIANRAISNEVAIRFQTIHQSPQMLVIRNGQTVLSASHYDVQAAHLERFI